MTPFRCLHGNSTPWIAIFVPFSVFASFWGYGVISLLITSLLLVLSTIICTFSKPKPQALVEKTVQENQALSFSHVKNHLSEAEEVVLEQQPENGTMTEALSLKTLQKCSPHVVQDVVADKKHDNGIDRLQEYLVRSPDSYSESESNDHSFSNEDSDVDWPYSGSLGHSPDCSDGSISDEESLIEIDIPGGHYVDPEKEDPKFSFQYKSQDFSAETIFKQQSLVNLLAESNEMNEEDNLIEIDIFMGSIKCSRFEIEA